MSFIVWEGVFDTFRNAKAHNAEKTSTDIFTSPRWLDITLAKTKEALKEGAIRTGAVVRKALALSAPAKTDFQL